MTDTRTFQGQNREVELTFERWFKIVNAVTSRRIGLSADDMEDFGWWDLWDSEINPREAVDLAMEYWGVGASL